MSHVTFTIKLYCGIRYLSLYMVQAEVDEKAGRQGRGRGAKQASLHTLMQVSSDPSINPSTAASWSKQSMHYRVWYKEVA